MFLSLAKAIESKLRHVTNNKGIYTHQYIQLQVIFTRILCKILKLFNLIGSSFFNSISLQRKKSSEKIKGQINKKVRSLAQLTNALVKTTYLADYCIGREINQLIRLSDLLTKFSTRKPSFRFGELWSVIGESLKPNTKCFFD